MRQHTAYVSLRQPTSAYVSICACWGCSNWASRASAYVSIRPHTRLLGLGKPGGLQLKRPSQGGLLLKRPLILATTVEADEHLSGETCIREHT